jgi:hypothetical protein
MSGFRGAHAVRETAADREVDWRETRLATQRRTTEV